MINVKHKIQKKLSGKTILFLHIPKCSGNSIYSLCSLNYGDAHVFIPYMGAEQNAEAIAALDTNEKRKYRAVCAHMPYGAHAYFEDSQYITMLRDPVDRVISSYYYSLEREHDDGYKLIKDRNLDIVGFAAVPGLRNTQSRYLMRRNFIGEIWDFVDTKDVVSDEDVRDIKSRLRDEFIFGLVEEFSKSIDLFQKELGWSDVSKIHSNATGVRPALSNIDEEVIAEIKKLNSYDVEIYDYAKKIFHERC